MSRFYVAGTIFAWAVDADAVVPVTGSINVLSVRADGKQLVVHIDPRHERPPQHLPLSANIDRMEADP